MPSSPYRGEHAVQEASTLQVLSIKPIPPPTLRSCHQVPTRRKYLLLDTRLPSLTVLKAQV